MLRNPPFIMGASSEEQYRYSVCLAVTHALRTMCEALREGLAVHREYEVLRSNGFAHDAALRRAIAIGPAPSQPARDKHGACDKSHARCAPHAYVGH